MQTVIIIQLFECDSSERFHFFAMQIWFECGNSAADVSGKVHRAAMRHPDPLHPHPHPPQVEDVICPNDDRTTDDLLIN